MHRNRRRVLIFGIGILVLALGSLLYRDYAKSFFASSASRIHVGIWGGKHTYVLSLGKTTKQHYFFVFQNSHTIKVPGGLKKYKIGALGKLAHLEHDPHVFIKALSQASGLLIQKTLYEDTDTVYYDEEEGEKVNQDQILKDIRVDIVKPGNLSLFDRIFVLLTVQNARPSQTSIEYVTENSTPKVNALLDKTFRNEKKLVQIRFIQSEPTALFLSSMLENMGIRVADISQIDNTLSTSTSEATDRAQMKKRGDECEVVEPGPRFSNTSQFISQYFECALVHGDTGLYEIQWNLSTHVEEKWKL